MELNGELRHAQGRSATHVAVATVAVRRTGEISSLGATATTAVCGANRSKTGGCCLAIVTAFFSQQDALSKDGLIIGGRPFLWKMRPLTATSAATGGVILENRVLTIHGTDGDDRLSLIGTACGARASTSTSTTTPTRPPISIACSSTAGSGNDTVTLDAGWGDETITFTANAAEIQRPGMVGQFANVEDFTVTGHVGGLGKVRFFDSAGNDNFVRALTYAAMYGDGFYNRAWFYKEVRVDAGEGIDVAKFYDSPGNDDYIGSPTYNAVSGTGYKNEAWYFEDADVYGTAGGVDVAKFYDSPGNDTYLTTPTYAAPFNTEFNANGMHGFYNRAKFFEGVHAFATAGGTDVANFYDSTANDTLVATPTYAAPFNPTYKEQYTNGFYNRAKFFEATDAFATAGGVDEARLYDSTVERHVLCRPDPGGRCAIQPDLQGTVHQRVLQSGQVLRGRPCLRDRRRRRQGRDATIRPGNDTLRAATRAKGPCSIRSYRGVVHQRVLQSGQVLRGSHRLCRQGRRGPGEALLLSTGADTLNYASDPTPNCSTRPTTSRTRTGSTTASSREGRFSRSAARVATTRSTYSTRPWATSWKPTPTGPTLQRHARRRLRQHGAELQPREGRLAAAIRATARSSLRRSTSCWKRKGCGRT